MKLNPDAEVRRIAANMTAEARGEVRWLSAVTGATETECRLIVARALDRAAARLKGRP